MTFTKPLESISRKTGDRPGQVWSRYLKIVFSILSYGQRETLYLEAIKPHRDNQEVLDLYAEAFGRMVNDYGRGRRYADHLGEYHMSLQSVKGAQFSGEYFTPMVVAELIADVSVGVSAPPIPFMMHEPACGSGRMILATAKALEERGYPVSAMQATAWDLSVHCFHMTYINLTLWGIPAKVTHGNTLSAEHYATQQNPFWASAGAARLEPSLIQVGA